jgi:hypothetical protein
MRGGPCHGYSLHRDQRRQRRRPWCRQSSSARLILPPGWPNSLCVRRIAVSRERGVRWQIPALSAGCSAGGRSSGQQVGRASASCSTPICPEASRWPSPECRGGTLDPAHVPKYRTPLLIPPVMPRAATITLPGGKPADYYEISMRQIRQQILPAGLPVTTVWGLHAGQ